MSCGNHSQIDSRKAEMPNAFPVLKADGHILLQVRLLGKH